MNLTRLAVALLLLSRPVLASDFAVKQKPFWGLANASGNAVFIQIGDKEILFPVPGNPTQIQHSSDNRLIAVNFDAVSNYRSFGIILNVDRQIIEYPDLGSFVGPLLIANKLLRDANFKTEDFTVDSIEGLKLNCHFRGLRPGVDNPEECKFSLAVDAHESHFTVKLVK